MKEVVEAEDTLGQQRGGLALALAHGPVRVVTHSKVAENMSGDYTDEDGEGDGEVGPGWEGSDGEEGGEGPRGERGLLLLAGGGWGGARLGGPRGTRRGTTRNAERAARAKRGRGDVAAGGNDVPDAPALKRQHGGARVGQSGRHGVYQLTGRNLGKDTPWLKWCAQLSLPGHESLRLGDFLIVDDAARAYDAEVRRRGWVHLKPLNLPQLEELAAYAQAEERCDERGMPLSLATEPRVGTLGTAAAQGASGQRPPKLSGRKPGKSGFFGVRKENKNKATERIAAVDVPGSNARYDVGHFATKEEAARAYDAEVRRRGWTHLKRLNFPDPADDARFLPSSAAVGAPGHA